MAIGCPSCLGTTKAGPGQASRQVGTGKWNAGSVCWSVAVRFGGSVAAGQGAPACLNGAVGGRSLSLEGPIAWQIDIVDEGWREGDG